MSKTIYNVIFNKELLYAIPGYFCFAYILLPLRFWKPFVFSNQTETIVIIVFFACVFLLFTSLQMYKNETLQFNIIDLLLGIYGAYLLCRFRYPVEKEVLFQSFSIVCIYLYFRNFPEKLLTGLLLLIPIAGIIQMLDGLNQFTMPWHNLSHITGIFQNTGLFGGFVALGFIVCTGLFFFSESSNWYLISIVLLILSIILSIQVYASGSRASWVAAMIAFFFLSYQLVLSIRIQSLQRLSLKQSGIVYIFLSFCILILLLSFSNYLYNLKKDSADGRLLIARVSMEMVKNAPLFGIGIPGFRAEYLNYQAEYFQTHPDSTWADLADDVETPFNEFLKILIEQGIIGLLLFSFLLYFLFERINQGNADNSYVLQTVILFILIFGLFSHPLDKLPFVVVLVFSIAELSQNRDTIFTVHLKKINYLRIPLLLSICFGLMLITVNVCCYAQSCKKWNRALTNFAQNKEESLSQLKELYPLLKNNPIFLTTYGKALNFGGRYEEAVMVLEKAVKRQPLSVSYIELGKSYEAAGFPEKALSCWKQGSLIVPSRFNPVFLTMKLYFNNKSYDKAQEYAKQLLAKKIKIDNPEIDVMKEDAMNILHFQPPNF